MKEPINVTFSARQALTLLSASLTMRHDLRDTRPELAEAEQILADAILKATEQAITPEKK